MNKRILYFTARGLELISQIEFVNFTTYLKIDKNIQLILCIFQFGKILCVFPFPFFPFVLSGNNQGITLNLWVKTFFSSKNFSKTSLKNLM